MSEGHGWTVASRFGHHVDPPTSNTLQSTHVQELADDDVILVPSDEHDSMIGPGQANSCLSDQHKRPDMFDGRGTPRIPKLSRSNGKVEERHEKVNGATFSLVGKDGNPIYLMPVEMSRESQSVPRSTLFKMCQPASMKVSMSSLRNLVQKSTLPQTIIRVDDSTSQQRTNISVSNPERVVIASSSSSESQDLEGFDDLVTEVNDISHLAGDIVSKSHLSEVMASQVLVVKTPSREKFLSQSLTPSGQKYTMLTENQNNPTHNLLISDGSQKLVSAILSPVISKDNLTGGGGAKKQQKSDSNHKASSAGLNMISDYGSADSPAEGATNSAGKNMMQSRLWKFAEATTGPLKRPPLHKEDKNDVKTVSQTDEDGTVTLPIEDDGMEFKIKQLESGLVIVCDNCGCLTKEPKYCRFCNRLVPSKPKWHRHQASSQKVSSSGSTSSESPTPSVVSKNARIDKAKFYSNVMKEQSKPYDNLQNESQLKRKVTNRATRGRGGKRNQRVKPYTETVTISSDDDEEPANTSVNKSLPTPAPRVMPSPVQAASPTMPTVGDSPSHSPAPIAAQPTCTGLTRKERMLDENGQRVIKKVKKTPLKNSKDASRIDVEARGIRIGTMKGIPYKPVALSVDNIRIDCETSTVSVQLIIHCHEIVGVLLHLSPTMPTVFLYVTPSCGGRIREKCKMSSPDGPYFDPSSENEHHTRLILIFEKIDTLTARTIEYIFRQVAAKTNRGESQADFIQELSFLEANDMLVAVSNLDKSKVGRWKKHKARPARKPPQMNEVSSTTSSMPSSPTQSNTSEKMEVEESTELPNLEHQTPEFTPSTFTGPVKKLIVYPADSATGAITVTNEDLFCLNQSEFLNDVIIDFYLKYLLYDLLPEEKREKTHVFISFFYKRLTQPQARLSSLADDVTLPPNLKRHARVKTWTRHVDIFSKDYVIIPINESAHWFLAIICFPGLQGPETVKYQDETTGMETNRQIQSCILVMDSLAGPCRTNVIRILREYLQVEWDTKKKETCGSRVFNKTTVRGCTVKVPQQNNYSDCGVFILHYAESFFVKPIKDYTFPLSLQKWFPVEEVMEKREEIKNIILGINAQQEAANAS